MDRDALRMLGMLTQLGLTVVFAVGLGVLGGSRLDAWLSTQPWFTLAGIVIGIAGGFWAAYQLLFPTGRSQNTDDDT